MGMTLPPTLPAEPPTNQLLPRPRTVIRRSFCHPVISTTTLSLTGDCWARTEQCPRVGGSRGQTDILARHLQCRPTPTPFSVSTPDLGDVFLSAGDLF
ncbi:hypothetical protein VTJ04DRAFT_5735 [Mycothermus thermophilus]|uniref:uncharacterized protein n=1 Tax=Humicola insolens TaxID=85995 RepID=UPI003742A3FD